MAEKDYIEREVAIAAAFSAISLGTSAFRDVYDTANRLRLIPAADVVEVVRCRDCYYKDKANVNNKGFLICPASGMEITDDDYCSYGERKEEIKNDDGVADVGCGIHLFD